MSDIERLPDDGPLAAYYPGSILTAQPGTVIHPTPDMRTRLSSSDR